MGGHNNANSGGGAASAANRTPAFGLYLSPHGLDNLKKYKYVSAPLSSWVDQKMTYFWEWAVTLMPMWLAPNLITTFSFAHAWIAHFLIAYYSPNLTELAPRWAYVAVAACMFLYQTLDAIDGKQARRTKNGSPLGQLFDHGCDAVTAWIMGIFVAGSVQAGPSMLSYLFLLMIMVPFFAANWEESCTSVMRFGAIGVTEGQFLIMGVELFTGLVGPTVWSWTLFPDLLGLDFLPDLTIHDFLLVTACIGGLFQLATSVWEVRRYYKAHPEESAGISQAKVSFVQFFAGVILGALWVAAPSGVMLAHPRLILCVIGAVCSYQASRLIICHTTGEYYSRCFAVMWPMPFVVANEWSGRLLHGKDTQLWVGSSVLVYAYAFYVAVLYLHFVKVTIDQITNFLGIRCFHIKHVPKHVPALADPHSEDADKPQITKKVFGKAS